MERWLTAVTVLFTAVWSEATTNLAGRPGEGYLVRVLVGTPPQPFNVLVDTGSTNFAIAGAAHPDIERYFIKSSSTTYKDLEEEVSLEYTQGRWSGELAQDVVYFPTLNSVPEVACDIAFITKSEGFFMNGSDWQGILGLAYPAIAKPSSSVKPWIDFLQKKNNDKSIAFSLTLCGPKHSGENKHYGSFEVLNNMLHPYKKGILTATIIHEWFYEIILTGLYVNDKQVQVDCLSLNVKQTIVDSGTTNVRLPKDVFMELVKSIILTTSNNAATEDDFSLNQRSFDQKLKIYNTTDNVNLSKEFWLEQQMACFPTPPTWEEMPMINIEIASGSAAYFRINLPASSYIRMVFDNHDENYCYKFAIEPSDTGAILGVVALEGFQVIFNRTARTVGFFKSDCGPNVTIQGPLKYEGDLIEKCWNYKGGGVNLLEIAAYVVCTALFFASCMFVYIFVQWLKNKYFKYRISGTSVSMSHASLINEDS